MFCLKPHMFQHRDVLSAPESYQVHVWDNDESTDAQMPFEIRVEWGN